MQLIVTNSHFSKMIRSFCIIFSLFCISSNASAKLNIFACESEWAALTKEITKDKANIYIAVKPNQDAHHLQARPSLINQVRKADLLVCNGADLEIGWLDLVIQNSRNNKLTKGNVGHFLAADHVNLLEVPTELDRKHGDVHAAGNPHLHLDPANLLIIAAKLTNNLVLTDPENEAFYQENLKVFSAKLKQQLKLWQKQAEQLAGQKIVVIHKRYIYLIKWLNLNRIATIEKLPGISPSIKHLKEVERKLQGQAGVLALVAPFDNSSYVRWLEDNSKSKIVNLPYSPAENQDIFSFYSEVITKLISANNL